MAEELHVWREAVLANLVAGGPVCQGMAAYVTEHEIPIGFAKQPTGARWTPGGEIELSTAHFSLASDPANPQVLGCVVHEAKHLQQGVALALTVLGEVGGWRAEFQARQEVGSPITDSHWIAIAQTDEHPTRRALRQARDEMVAAAGRRYLVWLLPLRPNWLTRLAAWFHRLFWGSWERA
jgi:hypothetical protein